MTSASFERVRREHPIAASLLVFLRHTCNPDWMDEQGFVPLSVVSRELNYSVALILNAVPPFNNSRRPHQQLTIDDDGEGTAVIKANTSHSIRKVCNLPKFVSTWPYPQGYIFLKKDSSYKVGDDVYPIGERNDIMIRFAERNIEPRKPHLLIDLWRLSLLTTIYQFDQTGVMVRGRIPAECITYIAEDPPILTTRVIPSLTDGFKPSYLEMISRGAKKLAESGDSRQIRIRDLQAPFISRGADPLLFERAIRSEALCAPERPKHEGYLIARPDTQCSGFWICPECQDENLHDRNARGSRACGSCDSDYWLGDENGNALV